jgi:hypothetical protein
MTLERQPGRRLDTINEANMSSIRRTFALVLALVLILALSAIAFAQVAPKVTVKDQPIVNGTVTIQEVDAAQDGWLVVHNQMSGNPGADLGHTAVKAGKNTNVVVKIDVSKTTPVLYAMLHVDLGQEGMYEFPGADVPVQGPQADVNPTFHVTNLAQAQAAGTAAPRTLPVTGGAGNGPLEEALLTLGVLFLVVGLGLSHRRLAHQRTDD